MDILPPKSPWMDGDMSRYIYQYHTQMNLVGGDVAVGRHAASSLLPGSWLGVTPPTLPWPLPLVSANGKLATVATVAVL